MLRVIEQTEEEQVAMYMKLPKKKLAEMLVECNRVISQMKPKVTQPAGGKNPGGNNFWD